MKNKQETKTTLVKSEEAKQNWLLINAEGKTVGRLSSEIAKILRGKHKVAYTPNVDMGDGVIVINVDKVKVTGNKEASKVFLYYTGHPGGQRAVPYRQMMAKKPDYILWHAVRGMMPKSRLGNQQMRKLRLVKGQEHTYVAQKPIEVQV